MSVRSFVGSLLWLAWLALRWLSFGSLVASIVGLIGLLAHWLLVRSIVRWFLASNSADEVDLQQKLCRGHHKETISFSKNLGLSPPRCCIRQGHCDPRCRKPIDPRQRSANCLHQQQVKILWQGLRSGLRGRTSPEHSRTTNNLLHEKAKGFVRDHRHEKSVAIHAKKIVRLKCHGGDHLKLKICFVYFGLSLQFVAMCGLCRFITKTSRLARLKSFSVSAVSL